MGLEPVFRARQGVDKGSSPFIALKAVSAKVAVLLKPDATYQLCQNPKIPLSKPLENTEIQLLASFSKTY
jgi:hypothetical protein